MHKIYDIKTVGLKRGNIREPLIIDFVAKASGATGPLAKTEEGKAGSWTPFTKVNMLLAKRNPSMRGRRCSNSYIEDKYS